MKRLLAAIAVCASLALFGSLARGDTVPDLDAKSRPSVLLLKAYGASGSFLSSGTGFVVSADGWVVTNHHVLEGAASMTATTPDERVLDVAGVLADGDMVNDIAILQLRPKGIPPPLSLGTSTAVRPGEDIVVIGCPLGMLPTLSTGKITAVRSRGANVDNIADDLSSWRLQIDADISPGSSGSPVIATDGTVVGVAVGTRRDGQGMHFALPIELAKDMMGKLGATPVVHPFQESAGNVLPRNLAISGGFLAAIVVAYVLSKRAAARKDARPRARRN